MGRADEGHALDVSGEILCGAENDFLTYKTAYAMGNEAEEARRSVTLYSVVREMADKIHSVPQRKRWVIPMQRAFSAKVQAAYVRSKCWCGRLSSHERSKCLQWH
ncbi:hypothetical protein FOMG_17581 [Fusarium oxysporum f. sp. melonis 26406]|nr:hypothetical protein FOMG_17581 [Fusarium oxysporum f. sp. melonis 26406]